MSIRPALDFGREKRNDDSSDSEEETSEGGKKQLAVPKNFRVRNEAEQNGADSTSLFMLDNEAEAESAAEGENTETMAMHTEAAAAATVKLQKTDKRIQEILKKAKGGAAFEKAPCQTAKFQGNRAEKRQKLSEQAKTTGKSWFDMPATELTEERKMDLQIMQMRHSVDPLAHYRKPDRTVLPKYFQFGKVVDAPADFYSSRLTKKERKKTIVDELLNDEKLLEKAKQRYATIQEKNAKTIRLGSHRRGGTNKKKMDHTKKRKGK